jgi:hypothetical protein
VAYPFEYPRLHGKLANALVPCAGGFNPSSGGRSLAQVGKLIRDGAATLTEICPRNWRCNEFVEAR